MSKGANSWLMRAQARFLSSHHENTFNICNMHNEERWLYAIEWWCCYRILINIDEIQAMYSFTKRKLLLSMPVVRSCAIQTTHSFPSLDVNTMKKTCAHLCMRFMGD